MKFNVLKFYNGLDFIFDRQLTEDEMYKIEGLMVNIGSLDGHYQDFTHIRQTHYFFVDYKYSWNGDENTIPKVDDAIEILKSNGYEYDSSLALPKEKQVFYLHVYDDEGYGAGIGVENKEWLDAGLNIEDTCHRLSHYFVANFELGMAEEKVIELIDEELVEDVKRKYLYENEHYDLVCIDNEDDFFDL